MVTKVKDLMTPRLALKNILKRILYTKEEEKHNQEYMSNNKSY
jgi:hypothetical protein